VGSPEFKLQSQQKKKIKERIAINMTVTISHFLFVLLVTAIWLLPPLFSYSAETIVDQITTDIFAIKCKGNIKFLVLVNFCAELDLFIKFFLHCSLF
jgi:hypothetical protein